jgi:chemotaxis methyl-accepting protein methylase
LPAPRRTNTRGKVYNVFMGVGGIGDGEGLADLLAYVNEQRGIDFSLYRQATIARKLELRLQATGAGSYAAYRNYLKSDPLEMGHLIGTLTIKVTGFFRDPLVFELLSARVIPETMARFKSLRMWSLGCASGQEPYSVAIIVCELMNKGKETTNVKIMGTDIDAAAAEEAIRGEYPERAIAEIKQRYVDKFFSAIEDHAQREIKYRITDQIRSMVSFEHEDIVSGLGRAREEGRLYHIILCRNVLIYMNRALREEVLRTIADVLYDGGYLVIGESETLPGSVRNRFRQTFPGVKIYCRRSLAA